MRTYRASELGHVLRIATILLAIEHNNLEGETQRNIRNDHDQLTCFRMQLPIPMRLQAVKAGLR